MFKYTITPSTEGLVEKSGIWKSCPILKIFGRSMRLDIILSCKPGDILPDPASIMTTRILVKQLEDCITKYLSSSSHGTSIVNRYSKYMNGGIDAIKSSIIVKKINDYGNGLIVVESGVSIGNNAQMGIELAWKNGKFDPDWNGEYE